MLANVQRPGLVKAQSRLIAFTHFQGKFLYYGQFQATSMMSLNMDVLRDTQCISSCSMFPTTDNVDINNFKSMDNSKG